jgi:hypothetical protein
MPNGVGSKAVKHGGGTTEYHRTLTRRASSGLGLLWDLGYNHQLYPFVRVGMRLYLMLQLVRMGLRAESGKILRRGELTRSLINYLFSLCIRESTKWSNLTTIETMNRAQSGAYNGRD